MWGSVGKKNSVEGLYHTLTPILIVWEVWKERNKLRLEDGYNVNRWQQRRSIIFRVKYWLMKIANASTYQVRSSDKLTKIAQQLGINMPDIVLHTPNLPIWQAPTLEEYCFSIYEASNNYSAAGGGVIKNNQMEHMFSISSPTMARVLTTMLRLGLTGGNFILWCTGNQGVSDPMWLGAFHRLARQGSQNPMQPKKMVEGDLGRNE